MRLRTKTRLDVLLCDGVREEGGVLRLGCEACFECRTFGRVGQGGLSGLCRGLQRVLTLYVLRVLRLRRVQQVDAQLLFLARTALEIQGLRLVELALHPGKHAM